jgi:hypothetical protein
MVLSELRERLAMELETANKRETFLRSEIEKLHSNAIADLQKSVSTVSTMIEEQAGLRKHFFDIQSDMNRVTSTATRLCDRIRVLDTTLGNLRQAKMFIEGLEQMKDVDTRLELVIGQNNLHDAIDICKFVHEYETAGFSVAADREVLDRFKSKREELILTIRRKLKQNVSDTFVRMLFDLGQEDEALNIYLDHVRIGFGERCQEHVGRIISNTGHDDKPIHVESVTSIFLEVADIVQKNQKFIEIEFGDVHFHRFISEIEYEANAHAVRVIRALMKATSSAQQAVIASDVPSQYTIATVDFCLEELVTVIMRCNRFSVYLRDLVNSRNGPSSPGSLTQVVQELAGQYVAGEHALISALFKRAVVDDLVDVQDITSVFSSIVDDTFYIFKKGVERSLLTGDPNCACAIVNNVTSILQTDLKEYLEESFNNSKRLFSYFVPKFSENLDNPFQGIFKLRLDESQANNRPTNIKSNDSLPHALGNISMASTYVPRFRSECLDAFDRTFKNSDRRAMFQQCLITLDSVAGELNDLHVGSVKFLLQQVRAAYITPFISNFDNINFDIDEIGYADMQVNDPFMKSFLSSLDILVKWVQVALVDESSKLFISLLSDYIGLRIERSMFQSKSKFSILGATQLYQDVANLISFFAQNTEVPVKAKFGRIQELCSILCFESLTEFKQVYPEGCSTSQLQSLKISQKDIRATLSLRSEFSQDSIETTII